MADQLSMNCRGIGGSLNAQPLFYTFEDRVELMALDVDGLIGTDRTRIGGNLLVEAYNTNDNLPDIGDMHGIYHDCCCADVRVTPKPADSGYGPDGAIATVTWLQARNDQHGNRARSVHTSPYQLQEIRNFDKNGKRTRVFYKINNPDPRFPPYKIADIRVPRVMFHLQITQYQNITEIGANIGDLVRSGSSDPFGGGAVNPLPWYNTSEWNGVQANTLLYIGGMIHYEGIPIVRHTYDFLTNDRGWNKFAAIYTQQNNFVPKELADLPGNYLDPSQGADQFQDLNGIGVFDMLTGVDFGSAFNIANTGF
jgi:hypothetical protein